MLLLVKFPYGKRTSRTSNKVKVEYRPQRLRHEGLRSIATNVAQNRNKINQVEGFSITMLLAKLNNESKHEKISVRG